MKFSDPQSRSIPTVSVRPRNLPADVIHSREVEWLGELKSRLAAVQAWRGLQPHETTKFERALRG